MTTPSSRRLPFNFFDDAMPFKIDGVYCKLIPLTKEQFALVFASDYPTLAAKKWCACQNAHGDFYAQRRAGKGRGQLIFMHRQLLGLAKENPLQGDHENRNGLDNRTSNLRIATASQNRFNHNKRADNSSGFTGVFRHTLVDMYTAEIRANGQRIYLGIRHTREEAAELYRQGQIKYHGDFSPKE